METRWAALAKIRNWDKETSEECWAQLHAYYADDSRHYHNLTHIEDCLNQLAELPVQDPTPIETALWFHDVIYDPRRTDNETASAKFARSWLNKLGESDEFRSRVERLIIVTDHQTEPRDEEENLIIDIDLSILGRDEQTYRKYADKIRAEYLFAPDDIYRSGRARILTVFLERSRIYQTPVMFDMYESRARSNLLNELKQIS